MPGSLCLSFIELTLHCFDRARARTDCEDFDDPAKRHHLLRLWLSLRAGRLDSGTHCL